MVRLIPFFFLSVHILTFQGHPDVFTRFASAHVASKFPRILDLSARDVLLKATWAVTNLSRDHVIAKQFVENGIHSSLVQLMTDYDDDEMIEHALDPLYNLLYAGKDSFLSSFSASLPSYDPHISLLFSLLLFPSSLSFSSRPSSSPSPLTSFLLSCPLLIPPLTPSDAALAVTFARVGVTKVAVRHLRRATAPLSLKAKCIRFLSMFTLTNGPSLPASFLLTRLDVLRKYLVAEGILEPLYQLLDLHDQDPLVDEVKIAALRSINNLAVAGPPSSSLPPSPSYASSFKTQMSCQFCSQAVSFPWSTSYPSKTLTSFPLPPQFSLTFHKMVRLSLFCRLCMKSLTSIPSVSYSIH